MQDPSTKKEESIKAAENGMDAPVQEKPVIAILDDIEDKDPDYLFHDLDGGEG